MSMKKIKKIASAGIIALSLFGLSGCYSTNNSSDLKPANFPKISVQLWSVKDDVKHNFESSIKQLAAMGFEGVEFANEFGPYANDAHALKRFLDSQGLVVSGAHVSFDQLSEQNFDKTVSFYKTLNCPSLIIGWEERAWDPKQVDDVVAELTSLSKKLAPHGINMGYHNHNHEFDNFNNTTFWDHIARNTPNNVIMQQDVGWTAYAGKDPVNYTKRYPGRSITTHFKLRMPESAKGTSPIIGQDTQINWQALIEADVSVGGTKWIVVEQELYPDGMSPLQAVEASKKGLDETIEDMY